MEVLSQNREYMQVLSQTVTSLLAETRPDDVEVIVDRLAEVELAHEMELEQTVNDVMADIGPDNMASIVDRLAEVQLTSELELQHHVNAVVVEICGDNLGVNSEHLGMASDLEPGQITNPVLADVRTGNEEGDVNGPPDEDSTGARDFEEIVDAILTEMNADNVDAIVDRLAQVRVRSAAELERLVASIFMNVLAEPHYCESYAQMISALRTRYPEFPPEVEGEKPRTFFRILLNTCQHYFESSVDFVTQKNKDSILACMCFFGHLYLRNLLGPGAIDQVFFDLLGAEEGEKLPNEHSVLCVCKLLQIIGHRLDDTVDGKNLMCSFITHLRKISQQLDAEGTEHFSIAVRSQIQDLIDLRMNGWQKESLSEVEKSNCDMQKELASTEVVRVRQALEASDATRRRLEQDLQEYQSKLQHHLERQHSDEQQIAKLTRLIDEMRAEHAALEKLSCDQLQALQGQLTSSAARLQQHRLSRLQRQVEEMNCRVCLERPRKVVFLPCKHMPLCAECFSNLQDCTCPVCRATIQDSIQTF